MTTHSLGKTILILCLIVVIVFIGYRVLNAPDKRSTQQKISDAIDELPEGRKKVARQLQNRTPADKLHDAAQDAGDDLKKATNQE
jgi:hypothetical protein